MTSRFFAARILHHILTGNRAYLVVFCKSATDARETMRHLDALLRPLVEHLATDANTITIDRRMRVEFLTTGAGTKGKKYRNERCDTIIADDLYEDASTPAQTQRIAQWWMRDVVPMGAPGAEAYLHPRA